MTPPDRPPPAASRTSDLIGQLQRHGGPRVPDGLFTELYNHCRGRVLQQVRRVVADADAADDVAQQAWVKIAGQVHRCDLNRIGADGRRVRPINLLLTIAYRQAVSHLRRQAASPVTLAGEAPEPGCDPGDAVAAAEAFDRAQEAAKRRVSATQWDCYEQTVIKNRSVEEVAVELDREQGTVTDYRRKVCDLVAELFGFPREGKGGGDGR